MFFRLVQSEFVDSSEKRKFYIFNTYLIEKLKANKPDKSMEEEIDFEKIYNNVKKVIFFVALLSQFKFSGQKMLIYLKRTSFYFRCMIKAKSTGVSLSYAILSIF